MKKPFSMFSRTGGLRKLLFSSEALPSAAPSPSAPKKTSLPVIHVRWPHTGMVGKNWGDKLNPALVRWLSERKVRNSSELKDRSQPVYFVIGSHLAAMRENSVVWGTGFIHSSPKIVTNPAAVTAVRGPLSRAKLLQRGIYCPKIYGDPAVIYPLLYSPKIERRYDLGVIQHFRDVKSGNLPESTTDLKVKIIDITGSLHQLVDDILSCERIVSSSLHGLIASHAYGIPAKWIKFSDEPKGDGFKFKDYLASVGIANAEPYIVHSGTTYEELYGMDGGINQAIDLEKLLRACPFITPRRLITVLRRLKNETRMRDLAAAGLAAR